MLSIQENKISMYFKVQTFFNEHGTALSTAVPALEQKITELGDLLQLIEDTVGAANENNQGYTLHKRQCRETMRNRMLEASGALRSFALANNDMVLARKAYYNKSALDSMRDTEALFMTSRLYQLAVENQSDIDSFGFTAPQIANFAQAIENFREALQTPAEQRGTSKAANQQLLVHIENADNLLSITDSMMETQRFAQETLYNQYRSNRLIDDNASGQSDPIIMDTIAPGATKTVYNTPYAVNNRFKLVNDSEEAVSWGLSTTDNQFSNASYTVEGGTTSTRLSSAMAASGDFVVVRNQSATDANITLFLEEL